MERWRALIRELAALDRDVEGVLIHAGPNVVFREGTPDGTRALAYVQVHPRATLVDAPAHIQLGGTVLGVLADGMVRYEDGRMTERHPGVLSGALRRTLLDVLHKQAPSLMREQRARGHEVVGDIVFRRARDRWHVVLDVCKGEKATAVSSEPSCGGRRRCAGNRRRMRDDPAWRVLGEFHTHPSADPPVMKPPSDSDLYQLLLSARNGEHSCMVVLSTEGLYLSTATRAEWELLERDVLAYYRMHKVARESALQAMTVCQQPIPEMVPRSLRYLHYLLRELSDRYYDLIGGATGTNKSHQIREYIHIVQANLGIRIEFFPW